MSATKEKFDVTTPKPWGLSPLTPEFMPEEHGKYIGELETALTKPDVRNIALSGGYGVGKSSVLKEFSRRHQDRAVELSLSAMAPISATELDESVPKQATTPTNRIQQEIVKQLLYRESTAEARGSRFRRLERFNWLSALISAMLFALFTAIVFLLTGWSSQIASAISLGDSARIWVSLIIGGIFGVSSLLVGHLWTGRLQIKQVTAGSAAVTLDEKSVSYFDQYLDEIVYYFQVSHRNIVIFEDIDRFDDPQIFDTLRSLNTILNASPQIFQDGQEFGNELKTGEACTLLGQSKKAREPIRFIYAVKDSIFDQVGKKAEEPDLSASAKVQETDPAQEEIVRANRTKFFDLIIPVVPFISCQNARDLALGLIEENSNIDPSKIGSGLLNLVARYVPDMRLLKNVCNEFAVFHERIFSGAGKQLGIDDANLFAMMLYKSTHPGDFEKIRVGSSNLDTLYQASRGFVGDNIRRLEEERHIITQQLIKLGDVPERSQRLGKQLLEHINNVKKELQNQSQHVYEFAGGSLTDKDLQEPKFWNDFVSAPESSAVLSVRFPSSFYYSSNYGNGFALLFTREHLKAVLDDPLDIDSWNAYRSTELNQRLDRIATTISDLRHWDMKELIQHPELHEGDGDEGETFAVIAKDALGDGLAYQLVRAGYINRNFTLYTTTFHGYVLDSGATNFIIHHVDPNIMDQNFVLTSSEAEAIINDRPENLDEPGMYNIAILDYLLTTKNQDKHVDTMITSLIELGAQQRDFIQSYLDGGSEREPFLIRFASQFAGALKYLIGGVSLDDSARIKFVNIALSHLNSEKEYETDDRAIAYLRDNYNHFDVMVSNDINFDQTAQVVKLYAATEIRLPKLKPLSTSMRQLFVARDLYEINRDNLQVALYGNGTGSLALDAIKKTNPTVYQYVLKNLESYMAIADGVSATIDAPQEFTSTLKDVLGVNEKVLPLVVAGASPECMVDDLSSLPQETWPVLAANKRFPATFNNVKQYIDAVGKLDENLAQILIEHKSIAESSAADDATKMKLAKSVLAASDTIESPAARVRLVVSLDLKSDSYIKVTDIEPETGDLFSLLVRNHLIEDTAATYQYLADTDWPTREQFIAESTDFSEYLTPALIGDDLQQLLESTRIDEKVKKAVVNNADQYVQIADAASFVALAKVAAQQYAIISTSTILKMAVAQASSADVVSLLQPHLSGIGSAPLFPILNALGKPWEQLTNFGADRPKIPDTSDNKILLDALERQGIVSSRTYTKGFIKVNKRRN